MNAQAQAYQKALDKLNPEQRAAVTAPDKPVLVLAGPGTGKTQTLGMRIAYRLRNPDSALEPQEVLCLTFTLAGAAEMRKRLKRFLGSAANQVNIHTYHSFCSELIQEEPERYSNYESLEVATDLDKRRICKQILDELPRNNILYRPPGNTYPDLSRLENLFQKMKRENLGPEQVTQKLDEWYKQEEQNPENFYQKNYKGYKPGDPKPNQWQKIKQKRARLKSAAELLPRYRELLLEQKLYDFEDMINWVLAALQEDEIYKQQLQERFQHILADEYQDTNGSQNALLFQLLDTGLPDPPDVFVVGDDDQAIYRFQGANMGNMTEFLRQFPQAEIVNLRDNYRSHPAILNLAQATLQQVETRLVNQNKLFEKLGRSIEKELNPGGKQTGPPPRLMEFSDSRAEVAWVAQEIERLTQPQSGQGLAYSDIAVLFRKNRQAEDLQSVLAARGIPYQSKRSENLLDQPLVRQILQLLRYLLHRYRLTHPEALRNPAKSYHSPEQLPELYALLHHSSWGLSPAGVLALTRAWYQYTPPQGRRNKNFELYIEELEKPPSGLSEADWQRLLELRTQLPRWVSRIPQESAVILLQQILNESGLLANALRQQAGYTSLQAMRHLFRVMEEQAQKTGMPGLEPFLDWVDEMQQENLSIQVRLDLGQPDGVVLSTFHSAKGAEYPAVFLLDNTDKSWKTAASHDFSAPTTLPQLQNQHEQDDDLRLFFVGQTRAEQHLYITWSTQSFHKNSDLNRLPIVDRLLDEQWIAERLEQVEPEVWGQYGLTEQNLRQVEADILKQEAPAWDLQSLRLPDAALEHWLEHYSLSQRGVNAYLTCPRQFYYSEVLAIPARSGFSMEFGNLMHKGLEFAFKKKAETGDFPELETIQQFLQTRLEAIRGIFPANQYERYQHYLSHSFPNYWRTRLKQWENLKEWKLEYNSSTSWDDIPLTGKIDRIDITPQGLHLVDYKTGNSDHSKIEQKHKAAYINKNKALDPGGAYWRQIQFYRMLVENSSTFDKPVIKAWVDYLQPNEEDEFPLVEIALGQEELEQMQEIVKEVWDGISSLDFPLAKNASPSSNYGNNPCTYCAYTQLCWNQPPAAATADGELQATATPGSAQQTKADAPASEEAASAQQEQPSEQPPLQFE